LSYSKCYFFFITYSKPPASTKKETCEIKFTGQYSIREVKLLEASHHNSKT